MPDVTYHLPTLKRLWKILKHRRRQSILRCLEYERMQAVDLHGRILDFGGGAETNYKAEVKDWGGEGQFTYESANIDPNTKPSFLIEEQGSIPVDNESFDGVISLNTFEHIYAVDDSLTELFRVLVPNGTLTFVVPFIFRVHGHPDDYHRGTPSFWERKLLHHGFREVRIEALTWGPFTTGASVSGLPGPLKGARWNIALILDLFWARLRSGRDEWRKGPQDGPSFNAPLSYFIQATK